jgi:predicted ATP-grasp superfamily ATP-dependent carboligase
LTGYFKEARVPVNVRAEIPIHGIEVDVFKMIIEWIFMMNIRQLYSFSLFSHHVQEDLERVYVVADMLLITNL